MSKPINLVPCNRVSVGISSPLSRGRLGGGCLEHFPNLPLTPPLIREENRYPTLCHVPLIAIVIVLLLSQYASAVTPFELVPLPHEGYEIKEDAIYFRSGNIGIVLEPATDAKIAKYYADRGIDLGNPFSQLGGEMQGASIFMLTLINRTTGSLTFTPRYITLKIKTEAYFPMDFTVLLGIVDGQERRIQEILQKSVYHSPDSLSAGQVVTKFLIFPALPKKFEEIKLEFDYLYYASQEIRTTFYFARKKE